MRILLKVEERRLRKERLVARERREDRLLAVLRLDEAAHVRARFERLGIELRVVDASADFLAALDVAEKLGPDAVVVTVFADDNKKYLTTDLLRDEPVRDDYRSPEVELLAFDAIKRACKTCCEPDDCVMADRYEASRPAGDVPPCPFWRS